MTQNFRIRRMALLFIVCGSISIAYAAALDDSESALKSALTFHASFDKSTDADFAAGDRRIHTAKSYKTLEGAQPGIHNPDVRVTGGGRFGSALEFTKKNVVAIYYQAEKNVVYRPQNWSGTVSFWLNLNPDQDLAPGFCDPIQVTDKEYNNAALWVDFSKDERPRHFRLGLYGDLAVWNPQNLAPDKNPDFMRRLVTVTKPPFEKGKWTHIVAAFSGLNSSQPGSGKLYLNGQFVGATNTAGEPFTWNESRATIRLGLNYTGLFDELSVFNRALTDAEVQTLYGLESGVTRWISDAK